MDRMPILVAFLRQYAYHETDPVVLLTINDLLAKVLRILQHQIVGKCRFSAGVYAASAKKWHSV